MAVLAENHYGKSQVRLMKIGRRPEGNDVFDWTLGVYLTGDFDACYREGDNTDVLTTDTMKNTVYAVARTSTAETIEAFALELAEFLMARNPGLTSVRVTAEEKMWMRLKVAGPEGSVSKHPTAFLQRGPDVATTVVTLAPGAGAKVSSGVRGLVVMKTSDSGFAGYKRDELTTLPETADRLLATEATIEWVYGELPGGELPGGGVPGDPAGLRTAVMATLLTTFAEHASLSVQHTLYAMGEAALSAHPELVELSLTMPNRHNLPANLAALGLDNPNTIFVPTPEPFGLIHARITRAA